MKPIKHSSYFLIFAFFTFMLIAWNPNDPVRVEIVDKSGIKTTVDITYPIVVPILTGGFQIDVPLKQIISIENINNSIQVLYKWNGKVQKASGRLIDYWNREISFSGKSDFGSYNLEASKIKKLVPIKAPEDEEQNTEIPSRKAVLEDVKGIKAETSFLHSSLINQDRYFPDAQIESVNIHLSEYRLAIPLNQIVSIKKNGQVFDMIYNWRNKELKVSGTIYADNFSGIADFGKFNLSSENLKQLTFLSPIAVGSETKSKFSSQTAKVILKSKEELILNSLGCQGSFWSTAGYVIGGKMEYFKSINFDFMRGESKANVQFSDIQKISFGANETLTLILKNGNSTNGKIDKTVMGWFGISDKGVTYISCESILSIEF